MARYNQRYGLKPEAPKERRNRYNAAMRTLRKHGYLARSNTGWCCGSDSSWDRIFGDIPEDNSRTYFWSAGYQGFDTKFDLGDECGGVYLNHGNVTDEIFAMVVSPAFQEQGLIAEWDGKQGSCIRILDPKQGAESK